MEFNIGYFLFGLILSFLGSLSIAWNRFILFSGFFVGFLFSLLAGFINAGFLSIIGFVIIAAALKIKPDMSKRKKIKKKEQKWKNTKKSLIVIKKQALEGFKEELENQGISIKDNIIEIEDEEFIVKAYNLNPFKLTYLKYKTIKNKEIEKQ